ncbi:MAG TPA: FAD-dependent monooxygenase [Nocardioidaceae bacterium]|nr:FAD-dependent monooxygenase [Nocardioidaceae bacterium]
MSVEQHDDHVLSVIRPRGGGPEETVASDYLVAADGAHSAVRQRLGIPMSGRGSFADCITIYFKADVRHLLGDRDLSVVYGVQVGGRAVGPAVGRRVDDPRLRSWTVGARVPHLPVSRNGRPGSTLDLTRSGFALLVTEHREAWQRAVDDAEFGSGLPIVVHHLQPDDLDRGRVRTSESVAWWGSAAIVRPDGVIAWKTTASADQAAQHLRGVLTEVLSAPGTPV